jgi:nicotinate-nucleotide pyrophosphorylase
LDNSCGQKQKARFIAKESGVLAGLSIIDLVFQELKETVSVSLYKPRWRCCCCWSF